jgi:hypothetical protein
MFVFVAVLAALMLLGAVLHEVSSALRERRRDRFLPLPAHEYPHEHPHPQTALEPALYAAYMPMRGPR